MTRHPRVVRRRTPENAVGGRLSLRHAVRVIFALVCLGLAPTASRAWWFFHRDTPHPQRTIVNSPLIVVPGEVVGQYLVVTAKWDRHGPYHFLIDTGASTNLVSPLFAGRYGVPMHDRVTGDDLKVPVRSSDGATSNLPAVMLRNVEFGDARFENTPALIYDCSAISLHLGVPIDGILGFPFFRNVLLTLDYPEHRMILAPTGSASALQPGSTIHFNNSQHVPIIPLGLGNKTFFALVDSGSDSTLRLNPLGMDFVYAQAPRPGPFVATVSGDVQQTVARLDQTILLGAYRLDHPVAEITSELPAIGGSVLKNFVVTFDQKRNQVTFYRNSTLPITFPPLRSAGISVAKAGAYWRIIGVIADSPAARAGVEEGDLITRINQEPVDKWGVQRYADLVQKSKKITFAFLVGRREYEIPLAVMDLVP